jgi:hypothetical protein
MNPEEPESHAHQLLPLSAVVEAESVTLYKARRFGQRRRVIVSFFRQLSLATLLAVFLIALPDFTQLPFHNWKNPVVVFLLICYIGKILLDTLFYDHYRP